MRDFTSEVQRCTDWRVLHQLLAEIESEISFLEDQSYLEARQQDRLYTLQLLLQYGEHKLAQLLG